MSRFLDLETICKAGEYLHNGKHLEIALIATFLNRATTTEITNRQIEIAAFWREMKAHVNYHNIGDEIEIQVDGRS